MLCYKDIAFCSSSAECANIQCLRNLTEQSMIDARAWWSEFSDDNSPPINFADFKTDTCGYFDINTGDINDNCRI
jgi:hypothetical protein